MIDLTGISEAGKSLVQGYAAEQAKEAAMKELYLRVGLPLHLASQEKALDRVQKLDELEIRYSEERAAHKIEMEHDLAKQKIIEDAAMNRENLKNTNNLNADEKGNFTKIMSKLVGGGELSDTSINDVQQLANNIKSSKVLSQQEKNNALSYLVANNTPASTGSIAEIRGLAFGNIRIASYLDTWNNNAPTPMNSNELNEANKNQPGRFIPAGVGVQALNKTALVEDIRGRINDTRLIISDANFPEFTAIQRAQIALSINSRDPISATDALVRGGIKGNLEPIQQDYLIQLAQLVENAMAMRSVLGAGQGSDELRAAIKATIPNASTPSKAYALKQLNEFERTIDRLSRSIAYVKLRDVNAVDYQESPTDLTKPLTAEEALKKFLESKSKGIK